MKFKLTVGGHEAEWELRGGEALEAWLSSRPWLEKGGARLLRVAPALTQHVKEVIAASAYGHNAGASDLRIRYLAAEDLAGGLRTALARVLGVSSDGVGREVLNRLARALQKAPSLFIVDSASGPCRSTIVREAEDLLELLEKTHGALAAILLLDSGPSWLAGASYDLSSGLPPLSVSSVIEEAACWRAYLHLRLAWEYGGDVATVQRVDGAAVRDLATGDDAALEAALNKQAFETFDALSGDDRDLILKRLRSFHGRPRTHSADTDATLVQARLLWSPPGDRRLRPTAWAARAAMRTDGTGPARSLLRGSMVCAPLARELLSRCFDIEAHAGSAWWSTKKPGAIPSAKTHDYWHAFQAQLPGSPAAYYPPDCPARPINAWDMVSFGELVRSVQPDPRKAPALYQVTELRNALAHGHYVSWACVAQLREIERQLG